MDVDKRQKMDETMEKISKIWEELGLSENQISLRQNKVWKLMEKMLDEIHQEETTLRDDIIKRIRSYESKVQELTKVLNLHPSDDPFTCPLVEKLKHLENEVAVLTEKVNLRKKLYAEWRTREEKLCKVLNFSQLQPRFERVPGEQDLHELKEHIAMLETEIQQRRKKIQVLKMELSTIQEVSEYVPESSAEKEILQSECESLSNETFKVLENVLAKAQKQKTELQNRKKELLDKVVVLWERLKIEEKRRKEFLSRYADCRLSTIRAFEQEIQRCESLKKENLKTFIDTLKQELLHLWNKCHISEDLRKLFHHYTISDITDETLEAYDAEVEKWKKYYKDVKHILDLIAKRQSLFDLMIVFENKAHDPNRFKNRKGNLLKEERDRKKLQHDLPALEAKIFEDIITYEKEKCTYFLYDGEDFRAFVTNQWANRLKQKENDKLQRQKQHLVNLQHEVTRGTPAKRPMQTTPKSAPSKLLKTDRGFSIRTPLFNTSRKPPHTVSKLTSSVNRPRTIAIKKVDHDKRMVLREMHRQQPCDTTTYSDFAKELDKTVRCSSRSSVLSTKKPGGPHSSVKGRKSGLTPSGRSTRNTSTTPAKLCLPFFI